MLFTDEECLALGFDRPAFLRTPATTTGDRREPTWVYLMQCGEYVKVGIANDVNRRLLDLQVGNPYPIHVRRKFKHQSRLHALLCERTIHAILDDARHYHEWFSCPIERAETVARAVHSATIEIRALHKREWAEREIRWKEKQMTKAA